MDLGGIGNRVPSSSEILLGISLAKAETEKA